MNMFVSVSIKKTCGKIVKTFSLTGAHNLDGVLLWIWRDLFVSLLAHGGKPDKKMIPEMLADIERVFDWGALERLLYGGKTCKFYNICITLPALTYLSVRIFR
jgi:hypothetical protein